ncbi:MAG: hypothetical protein JWO60_1459 [Frankiales bacterium]|nr:hypothetical protein [Frankiales bacterium]
MTVTPQTARATWRALEPLHAMVYFAPEAQEEYAALGFDVKGNRAAGYFPARAAAMGAVTWPVVQATFFNFSALACQFGLAGAWDVASPEDVQQARWRGAERALRRLLGDAADGAEVAEAAELATTAASGCQPYGRPLYAANAVLSPPDSPLMQLFHAQTLLREFRGDGHIAALVGESVTGLEAAVLHVAMHDTWSRKGLQTTRAYSDEEWDDAVAGLAERGWLTPDGEFTDEGRAHRQRVEDATDALSVSAYARLGEDGCARLQELGSPLSKRVLDAGGVGIR